MSFDGVRICGSSSGALPGATKIERHSGAAAAFEETGDRGVAVGPVAGKHLDAGLPERIADLGAIDRRGLVRLAGQAPVSGEIDEHGTALRDVARDARFAPWFGTGDADSTPVGRRGTVNTAHNREHQHERRDGRCRRSAAALGEPERDEQIARSNADQATAASRPLARPAGRAATGPQPRSQPSESRGSAGAGSSTARAWAAASAARE